MLSAPLLDYCPTQGHRKRVVGRGESMYPDAESEITARDLLPPEPPIS
jgi:hypothetical protein